VSSDIIGGASPANFTVQSYDLGAWTAWILSSTTSPTTTYTATADVVSSTGNFIIGAPNPVPTPVELLSFTAVTEGEVVLTEWKTASEINNNYFEFKEVATKQTLNL